MTWKGVMPAITTPFNNDLSVDYDFLRKHAEWLVSHGCTGIVALGSLGEGATLTYDEKLKVLDVLVEGLGDGTPVIAGISALSTAEAVQLARDAESRGCRGLMVLPPYVYRGDWREMKSHFMEVISATQLSCMLYNNPVAYGTDVLPEQMLELATEHTNLHAVKESSTDVRRITAIRAVMQDRLAIFVGVDDVIVEGVAAGAVGWIAGLVDAMPAESVRLFHLALEGRSEEGHELYSWFLPLLRLDTVPKFVQLIKLVQQEVGMGSERVRPPRLPLMGQERDTVLALIRERLSSRPTF